MPNSPTPLDIFSWQYFVDKIAIAIVLLIVGMVVTLFLQRDQARMAYKNELEKQRVLNLAEVWTALYEFRSRSDELMREMVIAKNSGDLEVSKDRLHDLDTRRIDSAERLRDLAGKYRFWLRKSVYLDILEAHNLLMYRWDMFEKEDVNAMKIIDQKIDDLLPTIDAYLTSP